MSTATFVVCGSTLTEIEQRAHAVAASFLRAAPVPRLLDEYGNMGAWSAIVTATVKAA